MNKEKLSFQNNYLIETFSNLMHGTSLKGKVLDTLLLPKLFYTYKYLHVFLCIIDIKSLGL